MKTRLTIALIAFALLRPLGAEAASLDLAGVAVTPHVQSDAMRYRREADVSLGARVQVFLRNAGESDLRLQPDIAVRLRGKTPEELLAADEWAWHDFPSAWANQPVVLPRGALTVWSFNGKRAPWGVGTSADLIAGGDRTSFDLARPQVWLSAVTFLGSDATAFPDSLIFHVANPSALALRIEACRLWLPKSNASWRALLPQPWLTGLKTFPASGTVAVGDRGGARVSTGRLPLTYAAVEVRLSDTEGKTQALWAHLRIKKEVFDLSGGWVSSTLKGRSTLTFEPFLKTLRRMHINTGHIGPVGGYTDNTELYAKYPLKYFNRLAPFQEFDRDEILPRIHAVEFLGEPQYGGGRPVPPQEVWRSLAPYQASRLATTVTHSEERVWRFYAGVSDFPHYDAYRVTAPAADVWSRYDRWDGQTIRWGAPLETIGDMTRSLRELNRPRPIAYWSQGAHDGWSGYGGRKRGSPTPDELRAQAYHALAHRITSLYWFNLSLKSLLKFPDLIEPITCVDREIRLLEDFYLEGDASYTSRLAREGRPDWDTAVIAGPRGALLFALDLAYRADAEEKVFKFGPPREVTLSFALPAYLGPLAEILRVDADGVTPITYTATANGVQIRDRCGPVNLFVASPRPGLAAELEARRRALVEFEESFGLNPGRRAEDLDPLRRIGNP